MLAATGPLPFFPDLLGLPLQGGSLFFGVPGQNPETNPATVYWDSAGTQPAAQPIKTMNGYASRNGTPATVFVSGDYSLTVRNAAGMMVYYTASSVDSSNSASLQAQIINISNSTDPTKGSALVGFLQAGAGAVGRTAQSKMREIATPYDFGAKGDGVTADQAAFTSLATAFAKGRVPAGTYRISANTTLSSALDIDAGAMFSVDAGVTLTLNGALNAGLYQIFSFGGAGTGVVAFSGLTAALMAPAQWWGAKNTNTAAVNTPLLQAWLTACQAAGAVAYLPLGSNFLHTGLTLNPIYNGVSQLPIVIMGPGYDGNGGSGGAMLKVQGAADNLFLNNASANNTDNLIRIEGFTLQGDNTANTAGGTGLRAVRCNNLHVKWMWISNHQSNGVSLVNCYGSKIEKNTIRSNGVWGIYASSQFNAGSINDNKVLQNGKVYSQVCGNISFVGGAGTEHLGSELLGNDTSYAGTFAANLYKRSDTSLTSIVVNAGTATATTAAAHNRATNDQVFVSGASAAPALNSTYPATITVTGATTFTFATSAANGAYNEASLMIGPAAYGQYLDTCFGTRFDLYSEDCTGPACYIGANCTSWNFLGGYAQGVGAAAGGGCGNVLLDNTSNGKVGALRLNGTWAQFSGLITVRPHAVDIQSSIVTVNGAAITYPSVRLVDGTYYSNGAPTAGTWPYASYVKTLSPGVGAPKGWYCTVAGTPGTWVSEGNL